MLTSALLNHFKIENKLIERASQLQDHSKAHYISFRTCEILKDVGVHAQLEQKLEEVDQWSRFNYKSHVIGGDTLGRVNHFKFSLQKIKQAYPSNPCLKEVESLKTLADYHALLKAYQASPMDGGFTYTYPNHFSQNRMTKILLSKLQSQSQPIDFSTEYLGFTYSDDGQILVDLKDSDSATTQIKCKYLIGTDGVRSKVRKHIDGQMFGNKGL